MAKETKETKETKEVENTNVSVPSVVTLENIMAYPYTKEGDIKGFVRRRLLGKTIINGKICQVNGFVTQQKGQ